MKLFSAWKWLFFRLLCCRVWWKFTDVSEMLTVSIIKALYKTILHNISEDSHPNICCNKNQKSHLFSAFLSINDGPSSFPISFHKKTNFLHYDFFNTFLALTLELSSVLSLILFAHLKCQQNHYVPQRPKVSDVVLHYVKIILLLFFII
jgi:hypothetical protein